MPKYSFKQYNDDDAGAHERLFQLRRQIEVLEVEVASNKTNRYPNRSRIEDLETEIKELRSEELSMIRIGGIPLPGELTVSPEPTEKEEKRLKTQSRHQEKPLRKNRSSFG